MARQKMLLTPSVNPQREFTSLGDFSWGTAAALWNFRWQVAGFRDASQGVSQRKLAERFLSGSDIAYWNIRPGFLSQGWEEDQRQLAHSLLVNLIATFEGWAADVVGLFPHVSHPDTVRKQLQFPSRGTYGQPLDGFSEALAKLAVNHSKTMDAAFYPTLTSQPKYGGAQAV